MATHMRYLRGGVRIGAQAMTTRGCSQDDFKKITDFLDRRGEMTPAGGALTRGRALWVWGR